MFAVFTLIDNNTVACGRVNNPVLLENPRRNCFTAVVFSASNFYNLASFKSQCGCADNRIGSNNINFDAETSIDFLGNLAVQII